MEAYGYGGTILHVDLTRGQITKEPLAEETAKVWLGGRGFNMKSLWEMVKPHTDPLGPDNVLLLGFGPLTGTLVSACNGCNVSAKSPLTGHLGDSSARGHFGNEVKYAGYDQIIVTGKSERPVYLLIIDDRVSIKDASHLWGKSTRETMALIKQEGGDDQTKVCCIGPAGENLVKTAIIAFDDYRAAGRTGMGAVMGSKNLKAVAVRGTKGIRIAKPHEFEALVRSDLEKIINDNNYNSYARYGSLLLYTRYGIEHPTRNFQSHLPPPGCGIDYHVQLVNRYVVRSKGCSSCPVACSKFYDIPDGPYAGTRGGNFELDAAKGLGTQLGQADVAAVIKANTLAYELGLDVIDTGGTIGLAMELYQRGIITKEDTDGVALEWGSAKAIEAMLLKIAKREGFGDILAEGSSNAARIIGRGAERYDMSIKGLSHQIDVRDGFHRLAYLTSTRGHDHLRGHVTEWLKPALCEKVFGDPLMGDPASPHGKPKLIIFMEHLCAIADSLHRCKWARVQEATVSDPLSFNEIAAVLSATTGLEWTGEELVKIGERIYNIEQAFCVREGITKKDFYPPWRMANEAIPDGPKKGQIVTNDQWTELLDEYFHLRGWNLETSIPTRVKLEELGLKYVADVLEGISKVNQIPTTTDE